MARSSRRPQIHPADRLALRPEEAAAAVGLSEGAFRRYLLPRCPKWYAGRSVRIPRQAFERFVEELAEEEEIEGARTAKGLLSRVDRG